MLLGRNHMSKLKLQSEQVGEAFAGQFLTDHFGAEIFIGPGIELKLQEISHVIFQDVPDNEYFGATVNVDSEQVFVAINTRQPLRIRYFTVAHEFWHLLGYKEVISEEIDHERAADRFAAAVMMPASLVRLLWGRLKQDFGEEKAIIMIADMAAAPYEAVARRILELKLSKSRRLIAIKEKEWISLRKAHHLANSPLDEPFPIKSFSKYESVIAEAVEKRLLNKAEASGKLAQISPETAIRYQMETNRERMISQEEEEDL